MIFTSYRAPHFSMHFYSPRSHAGYFARIVMEPRQRHGTLSFRGFDDYDTLYQATRRRIRRARKNASPTATTLIITTHFRYFDYIYRWFSKKVRWRGGCSKRCQFHSSSALFTLSAVVRPACQNFALPIYYRAVCAKAPLYGLLATRLFRSVARFYI